MRVVDLLYSYANFKTFNAQNLCEYRGPRPFPLIKVDEEFLLREKTDAERIMFKEKILM